FSHTRPTGGLPVFAIFHAGPRPAEITSLLASLPVIAPQPKLIGVKSHVTDTFPSVSRAVGQPWLSPRSPSAHSGDTAVLVQDMAEPITSADVKAGDHRLLDHPGLCVRAGAVVGEARVGLAEGVRPAAFGKLRRRAVTRGEPGGPLRQERDQLGREVVLVVVAQVRPP